jgi:hypothetical protein
LLRLILRCLLALRRLRLGLRIGAAHRKRIGLTDQTRQFSKGIAIRRVAMLICAATIVIMGGKTSVLISISHRLRCIPSQEGAKSYDKRMVTRQMPRTSPCARRSTPSKLQLPHLGRGVDAKYGQSGRQNRNDALDHGQARLCKLCIIIDNEA